MEFAPLLTYQHFHQLLLLKQQVQIGQTQWDISRAGVVKHSKNHAGSICTFH